MKTPVTFAEMTVAQLEKFIQECGRIADEVRTQAGHAHLVLDQKNEEARAAELAARPADFPPTITVGI